MLHKLSSRLKPLTKISQRSRHNAVLIPGDGIGPEMATHLIKVFDQIKAPIDFKQFDTTGEDYHSGEIDNIVKSISKYRIGIKGNINTSIYDHAKARNQRVRHELDLYANVIHAKSIPGIKTRHDNVDIVLIRENTEGEYAAKEHEIIYKNEKVIQSLKIMTKPKIERIANFAFKYARNKNRKKVTCVHKANIMKKGDGLFLKTCTEVAKDYPDVQFNDMIVDNTCMQLVDNPWQFDVMLCPNLYGNIIGNVSCGIVGGPGITAGSNYNMDKDLALFEVATRNTGDSIVGENVANPCAFLLAGAKLLYHVRENELGDLISNAVRASLSDNIRTPDLGGKNSTGEVVRSIQDNIEKLR